MAKRRKKAAKRRRANKTPEPGFTFDKTGKVQIADKRLRAAVEDQLRQARGPSYLLIDVAPFIVREDAFCGFPPNIVCGCDPGLILRIRPKPGPLDPKS
jgi:hypothetical protein